MQKKIKILYVEPNKIPTEMTIKNTLEEKQKLVKGYIEYTYLENCNDVVLICNEEGKINKMDPNRDIGNDIIFGPFLIGGDDPELGEDRSLTENQIKKYKNIFDEKSIEETRVKLIKLIVKKAKEQEL